MILWLGWVVLLLVLPRLHPGCCIQGLQWSVAKDVIPMQVAWDVVEVDPACVAVWPKKKKKETALATSWLELEGLTWWDG